MWERETVGCRAREIIPGAVPAKRCGATKHRVEQSARRVLKREGGRERRRVLDVAAEERLAGRGVRWLVDPGQTPPVFVEGRGAAAGPAAAARSGSREGRREPVRQPAAPHPFVRMRWATWAVKDCGRSATTACLPLRLSPPTSMLRRLSPCGTGAREEMPDRHTATEESSAALPAHLLGEGGGLGPDDGGAAVPVGLGEGSLAGGHLDRRVDGLGRVGADLGCDPALAQSHAEAEAAAGHGAVGGLGSAGGSMRPEGEGDSSASGLTTT